MTKSRIRNASAAHALLSLLAFGALAVLAGAVSPLQAQKLPCKPCGGLAVGDPASTLHVLQQGPELPEEALLTVAWTVELSAPPAGDGLAGELAERGVTPWLRLAFDTPAPLLDHLDQLSGELEAAARVARTAPDGTWFAIRWRAAPVALAEGDPEAARELAFLIKRASAAITGAAREARVGSPTLPLAPAALEVLYGEEVAAYLDALSLPPAPVGELRPALEALLRLDPGKPTVVDARPLPEVPAEALPEAARDAAAGIALTLFETGDSDPGRVEPETLAPFRVLAREFAGDLDHDPYSTPTGAADPAGWAFVRGEDLGLRIIAPVTPEEQDYGELTLTFSDRTLRGPTRVPFDDREPIPLAGVRRTKEGFELRVADPGPVAVLRLERPSLEELAGEGGLAERLTVESERLIPVEEILRRLQAFEDDQSRRLRHYRANNRTHLRFQFGTGTQTLEVTFEGDFFFRQGEGFDWAWQSFYFNGVRWGKKKIPEIPLVRPEKAAAAPLEILFTAEYAYRLRGTDTVDGRDAWVVDFRPLREVEEGRSLYQGTVWIDREIYARLKTRAVQLGLSGEVISNEESTFFRPLDAGGEPTDWSTDAFILPVRTTGQEILSILNGTAVVEKETILSDFSLNSPSFEASREKVLASDATMVRDTDKGLRYLVKDKETGQRVVQTERDDDRVFLGGGVFFDDSLDFPLPLGGINYFSFDFRNTGGQVNAFFAGALLTADYADPSLFGSRFDAGVDAFALAVKTSDELFRQGEEIPAEEVEQRTGNVEFTLGRPIGNFFKVSLEAGFQYYEYSRADDTAEDFVLPRDHFDRALSLDLRYSRRGWRANLGGSFHSRSEWADWGLPGNDDFDPDDKDYLRWDVSLGKNWYLPNFRKVGAELEYVDGEDLDRFSKYEFGFFSDIRVHGYQSDKVRAQRAAAAHLTYGFEVGQFLRLDGVLDAAVANDDELELKDEFLAGVGLSGTFQGPWGTLVNVDVGTPVAGPDDGVSVFLVFLKLLDW